MRLRFGSLRGPGAVGSWPRVHRCTGHAGPSTGTPRSARQHTRPRSPGAAGAPGRSVSDHDSLLVRSFAPGRSGPAASGTRQPAPAVQHPGTAPPSPPAEQSTMHTADPIAGQGSQPQIFGKERRPAGGGACNPAIIWPGPQPPLRDNTPHVILSHPGTRQICSGTIIPGRPRPGIPQLSSGMSR